MFDDVTIARFWSKVDKLGPDDCWHWQGSRFKAGYGYMSVKNRQKRATHISLALATGVPLQTGTEVCHTCDTPSCVNPAHLWAGTRHENVLDMVAKKRHHGQVKTHCIKGHPLEAGNLRKRAGKRAHQRECLTCYQEYRYAWNRKQRLGIENGGRK